MASKDYREEADEAKEHSGQESSTDAEDGKNQAR